MSRGLGELQREILETIPKGVHNLGSVRFALARRRGYGHGNTPQNRSFSASFCRAARSLIAGGYLEAVEVPDERYRGTFVRRK